MPRGKDAPIRTGGQIDPYVQQSMMQSKQQQENRLLAAMQEKGAARRTTQQETGAAIRSGMQTGAQAVLERRRQAAEMEMADKRAAEAEIARREDREFTETMAKINREFQAKESELDRAMQKAQFEQNREDKKEIAERQLAWDKFNAMLGEKAQIRDTNVIVSLIKGVKKSAANDEKVKTTMLEQADKFDQDKGKYDQARENVKTNIENDKRMDGVVPRSVWEHYKEKTEAKGMWISPLEPFKTAYEAGKAAREETANPMGVLQDQITRQDGKISVEDLTSRNIHKVEEQIINGDIKTEDINATLGALDAMLESVADRKKSVDSKSKEYDFWGDTHIEISQLKRNLIKLEHSTDKKIKGSETETVGKRVSYALRTIRNSSPGNRVSRARAAGGDKGVDVFLESMAAAIEPYEPIEITEDMDKYLIEPIQWYNEQIFPLYEKQVGIGGLK